MSFILDALRKSEAERQRQDAPGFVNVPDGAKRKPGKKWIVFVAGLLSINLVILAAVLLRPDAAVTSTDSSESGNTADTIPAATAAKDTATTPIRRQTSDLEQIADTTLQPSGAESLGTADVVTAVDTPPSPSTGKSFATFNNLRAQGVLQLPDMHLDIHVYSGQPADRFVFINMSKYKERATLAEGPRVKEITPEGVILEYGGNDFLLPRE